MKKTKKQPTEKEQGEENAQLPNPVDYSYKTEQVLEIPAYMFIAVVRFSNQVIEENIETKMIFKEGEEDPTPQRMVSPLGFEAMQLHDALLEQHMAYIESGVAIPIEELERPKIEEI